MTQEERRKNVPDLASFMRREECQHHDCDKVCKDHGGCLSKVEDQRRDLDRHETALDGLYMEIKDLSRIVSAVSAKMDTLSGKVETATWIIGILVTVLILVSALGWKHSLILRQEVEAQRVRDAPILEDAKELVKDHKRSVHRFYDETDTIDR